MSDDQAITRWAMLEAGRKEAQRAYLESQGVTWGQFYELKANATAQMKDEVVETEYGFVQRTKKGPIQWRARRSAEVVEEQEWDLKLLQKLNKTS